MEFFMRKYGFVCDLEEKWHISEEIWKRAERTRLIRLFAFCIFPVPDYSIDITVQKGYNDGNKKCGMWYRDFRLKKRSILDEKYNDGV